MTIWEYIAQPEHPWFDTTAYTPTQIGLFSTGAVLWILAYIKTIHGVYKDKELDIPFFAVCLNFGCEVTTALFFVPNMGLALVLAYWAWMVLDFFIVIGMFRYAYKQVGIPYLQQRMPIYLAILLPILYAVQYHFILTYDLPMAPIDSYIINLVMSICFVHLAFLKSHVFHSKLIAWSKGLGTGIISLMFYSKYPENNLLTSLYIGCAVFDAVYIYLLHDEKIINPQNERA